MSETEVQVREAGSSAGGFGSPPAAAWAAAEEPEVRGRLEELARKLARARNRRLTLEYLRLRRAVETVAR